MDVETTQEIHRPTAMVDKNAWAAFESGEDFGMGVQFELTVNGAPLTETTQQQIHAKMSELQESNRRLKAFHLHIDWQNPDEPTVAIRAWEKSLAANEFASFVPDYTCSQSHDSVLLALDATITDLLNESQTEVSAQGKSGAGFGSSPVVLGVLGFLALAVIILYSLPDSGRGTVPVEGVVTFEGKPLTNAKVVFNTPDGSGIATGQTDAQGKFQLSTYDPGDGAFPGNYVVTIVVPPIVKKPVTSMEDDFDKSIEEEMARQQAEANGRVEKREYPIPESYLHPKYSPLKVTVPHNGPVELKLDKTGTVSAPGA